MNKILKYAISCSLLIGLSGCQSFIENYQEDPVNITDPLLVPADNLLIGMQVDMIGAIEGDGSRLAAMWAGQVTGADRQYSSLQIYTVTASDFDQTWTNLYGEVLANAQVTKKAAIAASNRSMIGLVQIHEALAYGTAAALYGDVPFTQALQYPDISDPVYDDQADVYASAQGLLDSAIVNIVSSTAADDISADIFLDGDVDTWIEVAHTLKARFYLHTGEYASAISEAQQGISSASNNWNFPHGETSGSDQNLWYDFIEAQRFGYLNASLSHAYDLLDPTDDDGLSRAHSKTIEDARFAFYFSGTDINTAQDDGIFGLNSSYACLTYEENQLILAEAYMRNGNQFSNALTELNELRAYYDTRANLPSSATAGTANYDAYVSTDFDSGGIENPDGLSANQALLLEILEERYVSFFGQYEAFNDVRRTDNALDVPIASPGGTSLPQRFQYPNVEILTNSNTPSPVPGLFVATPVNQ